MTLTYSEWSDRLDEREQRNEETDPRVIHDELLERDDRLRDKAAALVGFAERPSDRERREHFDERRVRALLRVRTGHVDVQPLDRKAA